MAVKDAHSGLGCFADSELAKVPYLSCFAGRLEPASYDCRLEGPAAFGGSLLSELSSPLAPACPYMALHVVCEEFRAQLLLSSGLQILPAWKARVEVFWGFDTVLRIFRSGCEPFTQN